MDNPPLTPELEQLYEFLTTTSPEEIRALFALVHGRKLLSQHPCGSPSLIPLSISARDTHFVKSTLISPEHQIACAEFTSTNTHVTFEQNGQQFEALGELYFQFIHYLDEVPTFHAIESLNAFPSDYPKIESTSMITELEEGEIRTQ
jgi:hypothetical protein